MGQACVLLLAAFFFFFFFQVFSSTREEHAFTQYFVNTWATLSDLFLFLFSFFHRRPLRRKGRGAGPVYTKAYVDLRTTAQKAAAEGNQS